MILNLVAESRSLYDKSSETGRLHGNGKHSDVFLENLEVITDKINATCTSF